MRALTTTGDGDLLAITDVPDPEPLATEVIVPCASLLSRKSISFLPLSACGAPLTRPT